MTVMGRSGGGVVGGRVLYTISYTMVWQMLRHSTRVVVEGDIRSSRAGRCNGGGRVVEEKLLLSWRLERQGARVRSAGCTQVTGQTGLRL